MWKTCLIDNLTHLFTRTCGGTHPASPRHGDFSWVGTTPRSPSPASRYLLALHFKPSWLVRFESARDSTLHALPFGFNPGDATGTQGIGVWSAEVCWLHRHSVGHFGGQLLRILLSRNNKPVVWHAYNIVFSSSVEHIENLSLWLYNKMKFVFWLKNHDAGCSLGCLADDWVLKGMVLSILEWGLQVH